MSLGAFAMHLLQDGVHVPGTKKAEETAAAGSDAASAGASSREVSYLGITVSTGKPLNRYAVAWTGEVAYLFGGMTAIANGGHHWSDAIWKLDPQYGLERLPTAMPYHLLDAAAVWSGSKVYLFGGHRPLSTQEGGDRILEFDPATGKLVELPGRLPFALIEASATWTGSMALIVGGAETLCDQQGCRFQASSKIVAFDPKDSTARTLDATLPAALRLRPQLVWDGDSVVVLGGYCEACARGDVTYGELVRIRHQAGTWSVAPLAVDVPRIAAAWTDGRTIYLLGSQDDEGIYSLDLELGQVSRAQAGMPLRIVEGAVVFDTESQCAFLLGTQSAQGASEGFGSNIEFPGDVLAFGTDECSIPTIG